MSTLKEVAASVAVGFVLGSAVIGGTPADAQTNRGLAADARKKTHDKRMGPVPTPVVPFKVSRDGGNK